jgi:hypothetical protein
LLILSGRPWNKLLFLPAYVGKSILLIDNGQKVTDWLVANGRSVDWLQHFNQAIPGRD